MKFGRYRKWTNELWLDALERRKGSGVLRESFPNVPNIILEMEARLMLEAYHKGPWRMIWALLKHELNSVWMWYGWPRWEWFRTRVLRRPQDEVLAEAERVWEEMDAVEELARKL